MGHSVARGAIGLAVVASVAACALITNLGELGGADGSSDMDGSSSDALPDVPLPDSCSGAYACAIAAPAGWSGPFALYDGNPSNAPKCPTIAAVNVVTAYVGVDAGAPTCGACPSCVVTATATILGFDAGCPGTSSCDASVSAGTCVDVTSGCFAGVFEVPSVKYGCSAPGPTPQLPPVTYSEQAVGCAAQQIEPIDCTSGSVCVPTPSPPFDSHLCVGMSGDVACPGSPYSSKHLFDTHIDDSRACAACPCTANDAGSTWTAFKQSATCTGFSSGLNPVGNGCLYPGGGIGGFMSFKATAKGTCTINGASSATGTVTASAPYTVCCEP